MMNLLSTYGGTLPVLGSKREGYKTHQDFIDGARALYESYKSMKCGCRMYQDRGFCNCNPKRSLDNSGGGRNPHYLWNESQEDG